MTLISTDRLTLRLKDPEELRTQIASLPEEARREVSREWLRMVEQSDEPDPWIHGFDTELSDGTMVGGCGFKGPPVDQVVEIAYWTAEDFRGRGIATEAAQALADFALQNSDVATVRAHTLPEENASTTVLTKAGFTKTSEVVDPDDGPVWRWEYSATSSG